MRKLRSGEVKNFPRVGSWARPFDGVLPSPGLLGNDTQDHQVLITCEAACVLRRAVAGITGCVVDSDNRVASYRCYPCCLDELSTEQLTNTPESPSERVGNYSAVSPHSLRYPDCESVSVNSLAFMGEVFVSAGTAGDPEGLCGSLGSLLLPCN